MESQMERRASVLSLHGVALTARQRARGDAVDFDLGHREVAIVELDEDSDAGDFTDLCLGLVEPPSGEVYCLGRAWDAESYHDRLAHRSRIGTVTDSQVWPAHMPVVQVALAPRLYHTNQTEAEAVAEATVLARHFGLPGLPNAPSEQVPLADLVRAACVRAFLGAPEFVLIADPVLESLADLGTPLAQAIGAVQDRGGAVLWLRSARSAPAARYVTADQVWRLDDRGLTRARSPR
jgi:phospholipid/cholesterol/gamma-HCH transport system ATP-binding protein